MSQQSIAQSPHQLQAYLLSVTAELQQLEASLLRLRDCTERLRAANTVPGPQTDPLERMYEDLERAIRARPAPALDTALSKPAALAGRAPEPRRKARVRLRVVPIAPSHAGASGGTHR